MIALGNCRISYPAICRIIPTVYLVAFFLVTAGAQAGERFKSTYPCRDGGKVCAGGGGVRKIDGFEVHRDCWEWSYEKTCDYPSRDDCKNYAHCYSVADLPCLLKDSQGACVNLQREFSCKAWDPVTLESKTVRTALEAKDGEDGLVCKGVPCIDGNCVDKSYMTNGEMMDSVSKLYAASKMNPDKDGKFDLFRGSGKYCSKKPVGYSNCCRIDPKGWGHHIGAGCTSDEKHLMEARSKNLCVYVGKQKKGPMKSVVRHHFCCFPTLLDKVIQVEARKQLGMSFGSGGSPNCRGLTLEDIQRLDFEQMDIGEFIEDFMIKFAGRYKAPRKGDLAATVQGSLGAIRKYDDNPHNQKNNLTGWKGNLVDDSWEADEEKRAEAARLEALERERQARPAAERQERERIEKIEAEKKRAELAKAERESRIKRELERSGLFLARAEGKKRDLVNSVPWMQQEKKQATEAFEAWYRGTGSGYEDLQSRRERMDNAGYREQFYPVKIKHLEGIIGVASNFIDSWTKEANEYEACVKQSGELHNHQCEAGRKNKRIGIMDGYINGLRAQLYDIRFYVGQAQNTSCGYWFKQLHQETEAEINSATQEFFRLRGLSQ